MKKLILTVGLTTTLFLGLSRCDTTNPEPMSITINETYRQQSGDFAFSFLKELEKEEVGKNFFVSPLSLHMALGMLLNGADGVSKDELMEVLKLKGLDQETINTTYAELIEKLPEVDPKVTNTLANSIWQREGFPVEQSFKDVLAESFKADLYVEPFNTVTLDKINQWASDNTNAKIKKILNEISADQVMFLINALYFKGDWAIEFDKNKTQKADFNGLDNVAQVDMMANTDTFAFVNMGGYKALDMEYGRGNYAMRVLLPENGDAVSLLNALTAKEWQSITNKQSVTKVDLRFPKLKMEYEKELNDVLVNMGVPSIFSGNADLSKISPPAGKIVVGFVKQNAFVEIDEKGTEAAAVTTIGIELTSVPQYTTFHVNKPFLFFIYEKTSGTIQFAGKILNF
ncbi:serpin family protein [Jiulongibacter sediminis]|jgi:serpin B|uniref:serpin family protein n=1 Tax=Jiulongibacter sediminis TaxID=1605367 RepID=UPI0026F10FE8|nr:serpin family protein [Jiulongibacter sediminis]